MTRRVLWIVCAVFLLGRSVAEATQDAMTSRVLVRLDGAGAADAGGTVVLLAADDDRRRQTASIQRGGVAWLVGVPSGDYVLSVERPSGPGLREALLVGAREVVVVDLTVAPSGLAITRVTHAKDGEGADFDARAMQRLPVSDVWALVEAAAPFAIADRFDTGGLGTGTSALVVTRGESWGTAVVSVSSGDVSYPGSTGRLPIWMGVGGVAGVAVTSGLAPVEVRSPGVRVVAEPFRVGARWRGLFDVGGTSGAMVGTNDSMRAPSVGFTRSWAGLSLSAGGPVADGVAFAVSATASRARYVERRLIQTRQASAASVTARVSSSAAGALWRVSTDVDRTVVPFDGRAQFRDDAVQESGTFGRTRLSWDRTGASGARWNVTLGAERSRVLPDVLSDREGGTVDRLLTGVVPSPPADVTRNGWTLGMAADAPARRVAGATHTFRVGVDANATALTSATRARPTVAESVAGLAARVWQPTASDAASRRQLRAVSVFASDRVFAGRFASFDAGVRVDRVTGDARGAARGLAWTTVSPRLSWRLGGARAGIFGGVGRYQSGNPLALLAFGDPGAPGFVVSRWIDRDADGRFDAGEATFVVARAGRNASMASIDAGLRAPTTDEWTAGVEYRPTPHSVIRGAAVVRHQRHLPASINTGVSESAYRTFTLADIGSDEGGPQDDQVLTIYDRQPASFGQDTFLLTNPAQAKVDYEGIEFTYALNTSRWFMLVGATAYRAVGWGGNRGAGALENDPLLVGERFETPNAFARPANRLYGDRAYVGKWSGGYAAPGGVTVAGIVRYQDGQPFTRVLVLDLSAGPEMIEAYALGRTRYTYAGTIDARVEKAFAIGSGRVALRLDVFNLSNHKNEVEEDVLTGPTFRRSTLVQPPMTARVGVRVEF